MKVALFLFYNVDKALTMHWNMQQQCNCSFLAIALAVKKVFPTFAPKQSEIVMTRTTEAQPMSLSPEAQPLPETVQLDEQGLHTIFQRYYAPLCLFAYQFTDDRELAADLVQEAFIKLWELRTHFSYLHQVRSFLYLTVRNKALNELEHQRVVKEYAADYQLKASEVFFEETLIEQETYRILTDAIDTLPTRMKEVMQWALRGKKNAEIAELLDCSIENVRSLRQQAYKRLRQQLKDYYYSLLLFILQWL